MQESRERLSGGRERFPVELAKRCRAVPADVPETGEELHLLSQKPLSREMQEEIRRLLPKEKILFFVDKRCNIHKRIEEYYNICEQNPEYGERFLAAYRSGSAQEVLDFCMDSALALNASDLHLMAESRSFHVKLRIDGTLRTLFSVRSSFGEQLTRYIKVRAQMDIARILEPMEGRFTRSAEGEDLDIRVSIMPTIAGEKINLRILGIRRNLFHLDELGFSEKEQRQIGEHIHRASGFILVTGPTGCGKSTTLQAILREIHDGSRNIISIEDPVEYHLDGVTQVSLTKESRAGFYDILKFALRQDPDVIMIGEIRDAKTADTGLKAALTGHLVLSSLHTRTALGALERLKDLGIDAYVIADSLSLILNQRLIRLLCPLCREEYQAERREKRILGEEGEVSLFRPKGCPACYGTGYAGRRALFEILEIDEKIRGEIKERSPGRSGEIGRTGGEEADSLRERLKSMVLEGKTSIDEYTRYF